MISSKQVGSVQYNVAVVFVSDILRALALSTVQIVTLVSTPADHVVPFLVKILKKYICPAVRLVTVWGDGLPFDTTFPPPKEVFAPSVKLKLLAV
jgi:hypothetical protein